jgi:hypothetical protein
MLLCLLALAASDATCTKAEATGLGDLQFVTKKIAKESTTCFFTDSNYESVIIEKIEAGVTVNFYFSETDPTKDGNYGDVIRTVTSEAEKCGIRRLSEGYLILEVVSTAEQETDLELWRLTLDSECASVSFTQYPNAFPLTDAAKDKIYCHVLGISDASEDSLHN